MQRFTSRRAQEQAARALELAKERWPALASFENVGDLFRALHPDAPTPFAERSAVFAAVIDEYRERPHDVWARLLLGAFQPMIRGRSRRLGGFSDEEAKQLVETAFLEALKRVSTRDPGAIAARLKSTTRDFLLTAIRDDRAWNRHSVFVEEDAMEDLLHRQGAPSNYETSLHLRRAIRIVIERHPVLLLVLRTVATGATFAEVVGSDGAVSPERRSAAYEAARRRRRSALAELRRVLTERRATAR